MQILYDTDESKRDPILAAVGQLQLEVVQHRLQTNMALKRGWSTGISSGSMGDRWLVCTRPGGEDFQLQNGEGRLEPTRSVV